MESRQNHSEEDLSRSWGAYSTFGWTFNKIMELGDKGTIAGKYFCFTYVHCELQT